MDLVSLKTELRQQLKLTPQLLQSMEILQMNTQELAEYLQRATEENPLLDREDSQSLTAAYEELRRQASWIDGGAPAATFTHEGRGQREQGRTDRETDSLEAFLRDQLERMRLPRPLLALCEYMAELVDEDGYLAQEDLDNLRELSVPQTLIDQALETLQGLDPAGVCARDLSECLTLQLVRRGNAPPAVLEIVSRFLPELGRSRYGPICRELGISLEEAREAQQLIAGLDPHPGRQFQPEEPVPYVCPDIYIVELDGELRAVLNEYELPRVSINDYYVRLLRESPEQDTRDYLREKMWKAKWLLDSLERRGSTLQRCADAILMAQRPFFSGESGELAPLKLAELAETLDLHVSTVSRATQGKYLQCRQGTYPLRYFFSRAVGGTSRQAVKQKLLALVREEDPRHPLSDQRLCELLSGGGVAVARRTVAKYRMELGIGSSNARRR